MTPTREQILAEPAGPVLWTWVAEYVLDGGSFPLEDLSTWDVIPQIFAAMNEWKGGYSFYKELGKLLREKVISMPDAVFQAVSLYPWPRAIGNLTPEAVCKAALLAKLEIK